ncbi:Arp7p KNAG_0B02110 [Huiozyma naganishii CBS 8797]|uniref:Actin-related protein 7 n=1 Tax=Huiozyma naganishii (strain ATCC MYA-139 / BCRC 22969 / CBS 8797 / KCTC 17520 / NBRC 10181 / NCYC 3082 / Yp74L-3) TaxID=1071383 RepID=J7RGI1_HUIN7|nr:hypothetical protein KNAG_0B02110 [Kazachstania naganishii CBS 8797]CCK68653.1 hypothetical protein KNAG_0B02110 [Kazachstania naganishii CBS 8797]
MTTDKRCAVIHHEASHTVAGFSNKEVPEGVIPSGYAKLSSDDKTLVFDKYEMVSMGKSGAGAEVYTLFDENDVPYNWDALAQQWGYIYESVLQCTANEVPLVVTMPAFSKPERARLVMMRYMDMAFYRFNVPVVQFVIEPLAIALSMGKSSALVIDIGTNGCTVTPVYDGVVVRTGCVRSKYGGAFLDYLAKTKMSEKLGQDQEGSGSSLQVWYEANTWIQDFKASMLEVADKDLAELETFYREQAEMFARQHEQMQMQQFGGGPTTIQTNNPLEQAKNFLYRPTGKTVPLTARECYAIPEALFNPSRVSEKFHREDGLGELIGKSIKKAAASISSLGSTANSLGSMGASMTLPSKTPGNSSTSHNSGNHNGANNSNNTAMPNAGAKSGITTPEQVYTSLLTNVIITGAASLIDGIESRIIRELSIRFPQYKLVTFANQNLMDRQLQSWMGAATMANLPSWELGKWYTKEDYEAAKQGGNTDPSR